MRIKKILLYIAIFTFMVFVVLAYLEDYTKFRNDLAVLLSFLASWFCYIAFTCRSLFDIKNEDSLSRKRKASLKLVLVQVPFYVVFLAYSIISIYNNPFLFMLGILEWGIVFYVLTITVTLIIEVTILMNQLSKDKK